MARRDVGLEAAKEKEEKEEGESCAAKGWLRASCCVLLV